MTFIGSEIAKVDRRECTCGHCCGLHVNGQCLGVEDGTCDCQAFVERLGFVDWLLIAGACGLACVLFGMAFGWMA